MCGIAGYVSVAGCDRDTLSRMAAAIAHRGPDDEGVWTDAPVGLAYRRLSIIDPTSLGNQPVVSHCGRYVMVYNGEIYNYIELRAELESLGEKFRGHSDSEVLLAAYARWREPVLDKLNGMWAFAIWDRKERRLFASRDRFGKKPFYFHRVGGGIMFASEMKALFAACTISTRPDLRSVADFVGERVSDHRARTFFEGIEQLEPAHNLTWQDGRVDIRQFWRPDPSAIERRATMPLSAHELAGLLEDAVRIRLRADAPVGLLLSGGVDSSAVACLAASLSGGRASLFSTIDPVQPAEEANGIELVSARFPRIELYRDHPVVKDFVGDLEACLWHQEEPFADGSMVAHFRLMRIARQAGVKVLLTGQGADETLAGYPAFLSTHLAALLRRADLAEALRFATAMIRTGQSVPLASALGYALPQAMRRALRSRMLADQADWVIPEARCVSRKAGRGLAFRASDPLRSALVDCIRVRTLPGFLHYEDRNSMAHGVETRLPYLDVRLAERSLGAPASVLLRGARTKAVLREAMQGIVPTQILERLAKQGYPAPIGRWLRQAGPERWSDWMNALERCPLVLIDRWNVHKSRFLRGDDRKLPQVWRGLVLALWYRRFIASRA